MLKVKPTMRINKRYILIEAKNKESVEKVILDYIGIIGYAKAIPFFVESKIEGKLILSVERKSLDNVRAAFEMSNEDINIIRVSATLKGLEK